jgi:phage terminase large subunit-like protein
MNALTARIEAGSVFLPHNAPWLDDFFQEALAFPASRHSDQIDAFSRKHSIMHSMPSFEWTDVGLGPKVFVNGIEIK